MGFEPSDFRSGGGAGVAVAGHTPPGRSVAALPEPTERAVPNTAVRRDGRGRSAFLELDVVSGITRLREIKYLWPAAILAGAFLTTDAQGTLSWSASGTVPFATFSGTLGSTYDEHVRFGKTGAPATGNPHFALSTDTSSPPIASFDSWDGATRRIYWRAVPNQQKLILGRATDVTTVEVDALVQGLSGLSLLGGNVTFHAAATLMWGGDTNVYRSAANTLKTDDALIVVGLLTAQAGVTVSGGPILRTDAAGTSRDIGWQTAGSYRWIGRANSTAESGGNTGTDFEFLARDDAGANLGQAFFITRATRIVTFPAGLSVTGGSIAASGITAAFGDVSLPRASADAGARGISFKKARGSTGAELYPQAFDSLGIINFEGWNEAGAAYAPQAGINSAAWNTWSATDRSAYLLFFVTPTSSTVKTNVWNMWPSGDFRPNVDNQVNLGQTTTRVKGIYGYTLDLATSASVIVAGGNAVLDLYGTGAVQFRGATVRLRADPSTANEGATWLTHDVQDAGAVEGEFVIQQRSTSGTFVKNVLRYDYSLASFYLSGGLRVRTGSAEVDVTPPAGGAMFDGNVLLGTTTAATGTPRLDVVGTNLIVALSDVTTDATDKAARIGLRHRTNAEETITGLLMESALAASRVKYGGGSGLQNAATVHEWYTAANTTTLTGTLAADLTGVGTASLFYLRGDLRIGDLGRFDSTDVPSEGQFLIFKAGSINKWVAETINATWGDSDFKSTLVIHAVVDGGLSYVIRDPGTGGTGSVNTPATPVYGLSHGTITLELRDYTKTAQFRYFEWEINKSTDSGVNWSTAYLLNTTSTGVVHTRLDSAAGARYRYRVRAINRDGVNHSAFSAYTAAIQPVFDGRTTTIGTMIVGEVAAGYLSALQSNIGDIAAGRLRNTANTAGVNFGGSPFGGIPGGWTMGINFEAGATVSGMTRYANFAATGSGSFLKHERLELNVDGVVKMYGSSGRTVFNLTAADYYLQQDAVTPLAGILIMGTKPASWTRYLDLAGTGATPFLLSTNSRFEVRHDGTVIMRGPTNWLFTIAGDASIAYWQNDAATAGLHVIGTRPSGWTTYLDLPAKLLNFSDGTYGRVKAGLIGSYYGCQLRDSAGNLTLDTANSDGRLKLQIGKSTSLAPVVQLVYQNVDLSTTSTTEVSLASFSLPANALATDGDRVRITIRGRYSGVSGANDLNIKFGAQSLVTPSISVSDVQWGLTIDVARLSGTTQRGSYEYVGADTGTGVKTIRVGTSGPGETLSGAVTIDFRGKVGSTLTLYMDLISVEYLGV